MTLDEAVALLREARNSVALEVAAVAAFRVSDADKRVLDLLARINAALAAHDDKSAEVEWVEYSDGDLMAYPVDGNILSVRKREDGRWQWNTEIDREDGGFCATVDEAKAAALKAARSAR